MLLLYVTQSDCYMFLLCSQTNSPFVFKTESLFQAISSIVSKFLVSLCNAYLQSILEGTIYINKKPTEYTK